MENLKIVKWITESEIGDKEANGLGGMGGWFGFKQPNTWKDYLDNFKEEAHPMLEELKRSIIENGVRCTGEEMQDRGDKVVPLWSNGKVDTYTWRAWGDLMAAVWGDHDKKNYNYMDFYM